MRRRETSHRDPEARRRSRARGAALLIAVCLAGSARAQEFRNFQPIPAPAPWAQGAQPESFRPVARDVVEQALQTVFKAWNTSQLLGLLGDTFYDSSRLLDALARTPRDARIRILSIEAIKTLRQTVQPPGDRERTVTVRSTVSAWVRTQIEFNDPGAGYQTRDGLNEYIFEVIERLPR